MAITVENSAHTNWGRWSAQQPSPEYVMAEASELMEYDSRPTNPAPLQRPPVTPPFMVSNSYSMAPMNNLPAPHYHAANPFGFESYGPPSPNPVVTPYRPYHDGLPALRYSPGPGRRHHEPTYPQERPQQQQQHQQHQHQQQQGCAEEQNHSHSHSHSHPPVKSESQHNISTPASMAPNTPAESKIVAPNVDDTGANRIAFFTEVDRLMRAVQLKDECEKKKQQRQHAPAPAADDRGESYYPSPPHLDHASVERDLKPDGGPEEKGAEKAHVCRIKRCGRRFTQKTHLDTHKRTHTGEQPYQCTIPGCGEWFSQLGNLKIHERRHLGEKPFVCGVCDKRFPQKANLRSHEETHSGIKRFSCRLGTCTKKFGQRGNLKSHMNKFHAAELEAWQHKFQVKREDELTPEELDMRKYFATQFRNSNKGIKGRGRGRHVKTITAMASNNNNINNSGNISVPSHHHQPVQQQQHTTTTTSATTIPMHLPLPHPTAPHMGGFPPHYGIPRNDPGNGGMHGRGAAHGAYDIYDMGHGGNMDGGHHGAGTAGSILEEDRHRGLGFQDRFHDRLY